MPAARLKPRTGCTDTPRIIGDRLRANHCETQKREALIVVNVINRMTALGMPESVKIVA